MMSRVELSVQESQEFGSSISNIASGVKDQITVIEIAIGTFI
jgi:hypothetical protein